jgi:hypothetical protein
MMNYLGKLALTSSIAYSQVLTASRSRFSLSRQGISTWVGICITILLKLKRVYISMRRTTNKPLIFMLCLVRGSEELMVFLFDSF